MEQRSNTQAERQLPTLPEMPYRFYSGNEDHIHYSFLDGVQVNREMSTQKRGNILIIESMHLATESPTPPINLKVGDIRLWDFKRVLEPNLGILYRSHVKLIRYNWRVTPGSNKTAVLIFRIERIE